MSLDEGSGPGRAGAFHGRRKGKRLRAGQEDAVRDLLPRLRLPEAGPIDPAALFPGAPSEVRLEIGFGGGEHLAGAARARPDVGFVGCEPFVNGMAKLLRLAARDALANLRVWDRDAAELLTRWPDASLARVDLLYPDPWPKRRQRKRRFVSDASLAEIARTLRPGGVLRFATDIDDYAGWTLARALRAPDLAWTATRAGDWERPPEDWIETRYEAKARGAGRRPTYLAFVRR